ncbi:hypothetical protein F4780DRAFT_752443 [Xylariomycetidae sp. FL0641]|nr:hypothetical protein F4780DRAFT_752443 [Xylariomycetidae sp. FL0641]
MPSEGEMPPGAAAPPTGEQIAAMAYALPPVQVQDLALAVEVTAIVLGVLSASIVGLRIWVRAGFSGAVNRTWGMDDWLCVIGFLPFIPSVPFAVLAARYGVGTHDADLASPLYSVRAYEFVIYWELLYFISSTVIKCSIGFACIRIDKRRRILYPVCVNMSVMVIIAVLAIIFVFANCKPLAATWNPALGTCQKAITLETVSYIVSAVQMATDWTCSIIPCFIVAHLQMPPRKKVAVVFVLGLGILASIATIVRMPLLKYYDVEAHPVDLLFHVGMIVICSNVECSLGIIASSLPSLSKLFMFWYKTSSKDDSEATDSSGSFPTRLPALTPQGKYVSTAHIRKGSGDWNRLDDEDSSQRGIIRKTEYSVEVTR